MVDLPFQGQRPIPEDRVITKDMWDELTVDRDTLQPTPPDHPNAATLRDMTNTGLSGTKRKVRASIMGAYHTSPAQFEAAQQYWPDAYYLADDIEDYGGRILIPADDGNRFVDMDPGQGKRWIFLDPPKMDYQDITADVVTMPAQFVGAMFGLATPLGRAAKGAGRLRRLAKGNVGMASGSTVADMFGGAYLTSKYYLGDLYPEGAQFPGHASRAELGADAVNWTTEFLAGLGLDYAGIGLSKAGSWIGNKFRKLGDKITGQKARKETLDMQKLLENPTSPETVTAITQGVNQVIGQPSLPGGPTKAAAAEQLYMETMVKQLLGEQGFRDAMEKGKVSEDVVRAGIENMSQTRGFPTAGTTAGMMITDRGHPWKMFENLAVRGRTTRQQMHDLMGSVQRNAHDSIKGAIDDAGVAPRHLLRQNEILGTLDPRVPKTTGGYIEGGLADPNAAQRGGELVQRLIDEPYEKVDEFLGGERRIHDQSWIDDLYARDMANYGTDPNVYEADEMGRRFLDIMGPQEIGPKTERFAVPEYPGFFGGVSSNYKYSSAEELLAARPDIGPYTDESLAASVIVGTDKGYSTKKKIWNAKYERAGDLTEIGADQFVTDNLTALRQQYLDRIQAYAGQDTKDLEGAVSRIDGLLETMSGRRPQRDEAGQLVRDDNGEVVMEENPDINLDLMVKRKAAMGDEIWNNSVARNTGNIADLSVGAAHLEEIRSALRDDIYASADNAAEGGLNPVLGMSPDGPPGVGGQFGAPEPRPQVTPSDVSTMTEAVRDVGDYVMTPQILGTPYMLPDRPRWKTMHGQDAVDANVTRDLLGNIDRTGWPSTNYNTDYIENILEDMPNFADAYAHLTQYSNPKILQADAIKGDIKLRLANQADNQHITSDSGASLSAQIPYSQQMFNQQELPDLMDEVQGVLNTKGQTVDELKAALNEVRDLRKTGASTDRYVDNFMDNFVDRHVNQWEGWMDSNNIWKFNQDRITTAAEQISQLKKKYLGDVPETASDQAGRELPAFNSSLDYENKMWDDRDAGITQLRQAGGRRVHEDNLNPEEGLENWNRSEHWYEPEEVPEELILEPVFQHWWDQAIKKVMRPGNSEGLADALKNIDNLTKGPLIDNNWWNDKMMQTLRPMREESWEQEYNDAIQKILDEGIEFPGTTGAFGNQIVAKLKNDIDNKPEPDFDDLEGLDRSMDELKDWIAKHAEEFKDPRNADRIDKAVDIIAEKGQDALNVPQYETTNAIHAIQDELQPILDKMRQDVYDNEEAYRRIRAKPTEFPDDFPSQQMSPVSEEWMQDIPAAMEGGGSTVARFPVGPQEKVSFPIRPQGGAAGGPPPNQPTLPGVEAAAPPPKKPSDYLRESDEYYEAVMNNDVRPVIKELFKDGITDKQIADFVLKGSEGSAKRLNELRRNMPAEEWNAVRSKVGIRMGMQNPQVGGPENFDMRLFITNFEKLSPQAQEILFGQAPIAGGSPNNPLDLSRDTMNRIIDYWKANEEAIDWEFNTQGNFLIELGALFGITGALGGLATVGVGAALGDAATMGAGSITAGVGVSGALGYIYGPRLFMKMTSSDRFTRWNMENMAENIPKTPEELRKALIKASKPEYKARRRQLYKTALALAFDEGFGPEYQQVLEGLGLIVDGTAEAFEYQDIDGVPRQPPQQEQPQPQAVGDDSWMQDIQRAGVR